MAIRKIPNGMTGAEASTLLFENDSEANELRDWSAANAPYLRNTKAIGPDGVLYRVKPTAPVAGTSQTPSGTASDWQAVGGSGGASDWIAKAYKKGDRVFYKGGIYRAGFDTLTADAPGTSYKWLEEVKGTAGINLLTLPNTNIDPTTGVFTTHASYSNWVCSEKMPATVGDQFLFSRILRGGPVSEIQGIYAWDAGGNFLGRPANSNESEISFTVKDPAIATVAFQLFKNRNARLDRVTRDTTQEVFYNRYNVNGNLFTAARENVGANIKLNQVIDNSMLPLAIPLTTKTSATVDASNSFRIVKTFGATEYKQLSFWATIRLKSIGTAGVTTIPFGTKSLRVGETYKMYFLSSTVNVIPYLEIASAITEQPVDYVIEILQVGSAINNGYAIDQTHKKSWTGLAGLPFNTHADVANQALSIACPLLFGGDMAALGDSITHGAEGSAFRILAEDLGMKLTNLGLPGKNLPDILSLGQLALIPRTANIIFMTGGTNGWFVDGDVNSTDTANIYGLVNRALDYVYTNMPQAQVVLVTPSQVRTFSTAIRDTAKAFRKISEERGVMLCDWYSNLGVNSINAAKYLSDNVHPNAIQLGYMAYRLKQSIILPFLDLRAYGNAPYMTGHTL